MQNLEKNLWELTDKFRGKDFLKDFFCILMVWKKLSVKKDFPSNLSFKKFYSEKIEFSRLKSIFKKLSKNYKIFTLYSIDNIEIEDEKLVEIVQLSENFNDVNSYEYLYFTYREMNKFSTSSQIQKISMALLNEGISEIYIPFSFDFLYIYYTDKDIFIENNYKKSSFLYECIKMLENKNIIYANSNAIDNPYFINTTAPHLLKEFDGVFATLPFFKYSKMSFEIKKDKYRRFLWSNNKNIELMMIEHIINQTKKRAIIQLPASFCFKSTSGYFEIRKHLTKILDGVIQLPANIHQGTNTSTVLLALDKEKKDNNVFFMNLAHDEFIQRQGRVTILKNEGKIIEIFNKKEEIENISAISTSATIEKNSFILLVDKYVTSDKIKKLNEKLSNYNLTRLDKIAEVRRSQTIKSEKNKFENRRDNLSMGKIVGGATGLAVAPIVAGVALATPLLALGAAALVGAGLQKEYSDNYDEPEDMQEIYEIIPSDFPISGFIDCDTQLKAKTVLQQEKKIKTYQLKPYDILVSTKGSTGKIAIVGKIDNIIIASQAVDVVRLKEKSEKEAIALYMYLKSNSGQTLLNTLSSNTTMPQITTSNLKTLEVPIFTNKDIDTLNENFYKEIKLHDEIKKIGKKIKSISDDF